MKIPFNHPVDVQTEMYTDNGPKLQHIYQWTEGRQHVAEGLSCWCHPERSVENPNIIIHHTPA